MTDQLAYVMITPYSLYKSRTGGIIGRLLAHTKLELVGSRMFVFSDQFLDQYKKLVCTPDMDPTVVEAWEKYIDNSLRQKNPYNLLPRCMLMLFKGPQAVRHLKEEIIGSFSEQPTGNTIRGTYGDFVRDAAGKIHYFEPAVITCPDPQLNDAHLKLIADYATSDNGILEGRIKYEHPNVQVSLVMLKPDNFERRSRRPGNIIDAFSLTGLRIVGAKLVRMTVAMAEEFYGPLKDIFIRKLKGNVAQEVFQSLHDKFNFSFTMGDAEKVADMLAERNAITEFNRIVEYMTGVNPEDICDSEKKSANRAKCLALLYEGPDAVERIRAVLGSTDPNKAEPGTVRSDFGRDLMRNGAHASDSPENAARERKIIGLSTNETGCTIADTINQYLAEAK